jgi:hypothetical protein
MTRNRDEFEERNVERVFAELRDGIEAPAEDDLRVLARAASSSPRDLPQPARVRRGFPPRARWTVVATAAALLVGSGLGFGVGNSVTPAVQAGTTPFAGTGFLPAQGWNVVQAGTATARRPATAVAANVRLHPSDRPGRIPMATIASLPAHGVLIHATFTTRGDPTRDALFRERSLPLQVGWAKQEAPNLYRLRAGTGGSNVDARIHFGTAHPTKEMLGEAQLQLGRLVVAPGRVTMIARPTTLRPNQGSLLSGAVSSGRADEEVTIQARDCGQKTFTGVAAILTHDGGTWNTQFSRGINSTIRAVWKGEASPTIELRQQASVVLRRQSAGRYLTAIASRWTFWRKKVQIQRRVGSRWKTVRTLTLTDTFAHSGTGTTWTEAKFRLRMPRGTALRAMVTADQAKPCYLGTVSDTVRA